MEPFWTFPKPGPVPKSKTDDSVEARPLKMSRFDPPEPGPVPKRKNDDSQQARPFKMSRFGSPERRLPPVLAPLRTLVSNPKDTAPPNPDNTRRHPHDALLTNPKPWSAIPNTRRHPHDALLTNPNDTALPRPRPGQQSPRHGAQTTRCPAILMAQRRPRETPTRHSATHATRPAAIPIPSDAHAIRPAAIPWHSGTHAARPPAVPMAQRRACHTSDTPDAHRHSLPLRSTAQRRTRDTPDAACRCVPRKAGSKLTSTNPRIPCACHDFATPNARPHTRFVAQGHENLATAHDSLRLPRGSTVQCLPERINASEVPHLPRETQVAARKIMRVCDAPGTQSPRQSAASTPAACPRHTSQHARSPQPATRNAR